MKELLNSEIKKSRRGETCILGGLLLILFIINYSYLDSFLIEFISDEECLIKQKECLVERVVDGDTIIACGNSTRLLGINTPEKKEEYYLEAKNFLTKEIENKSVKIVFSFERMDKYGRVLGYVYFNQENVNQKIIENGFANSYFPSSKDKYFKPFLSSWEKCIKENKNLCEKSLDLCANCIFLKKLDFEKEEVVLENRCSFSCNLTNWRIKDEGRKMFIFPNIILDSKKEIKISVNGKGDLVWKRSDYVWTDSGDTLFLRDSSGKLVLWSNYF